MTPNVEALGALSMLYERAKEFDALAHVLEKQAEVTFEAPARIQILNKLGTIYGDRLNNDEGVPSPGVACAPHPGSERSKAAQIKRWQVADLAPPADGDDPQDLLRRDRQVGRVHSRPRAAGVEGDQGRREDRAPLQDRPALGGQEAEARSRRQVLREGARARPAEPSQAAEALIPIYSAASNAKALANAIEVLGPQRQDGATKLSLSSRRWQASTTVEVKDPAKAFERYLAAFEIAPGDERTTADVERAAKVDRGLGSGHRAAYTQAIAQAPTPDGDIALGVAAAPPARARPRRRGAAALTTPSPPTARSKEAEDGEHRGARCAGASLQAKNVPLSRTLLGVYEKKTRPRPRSRPRRRRIQLRDRQALRDGRSKTSTRRSRTYNAVLEDEPTDGRALARPRRALRPASVAGSRTSKCCVGGSSSTSPKPEIIDLKYRLGQTLEKHLGSDPPGAPRKLSRDPLPPARQHRRRAHRARSAALRIRTCGPKRPPSSSPSTKSAADHQKLIGALEIL